MFCCLMDSGFRPTTHTFSRRRRNGQKTGRNAVAGRFQADSDRLGPVTRAAFHVRRVYDEPRESVGAGAHSSVARSAWQPAVCPGENARRVRKNRPLRSRDSRERSSDYGGDHHEDHAASCAHPAPAAARPHLREHDQALSMTLRGGDAMEGNMSMDQAGPGFERDIRPLFRAEDSTRCRSLSTSRPTRTCG
jgi:hypothetical protein